MKKNGFTLIELLAAIAVLAMIIVIAVPAISGITSIINDNQRENVIRRIEVAASNYAKDTGKTLIFVEELIKEGYLDSGKDSDIIEDPLTHKSLNCYVIEMTKNGDYYDAVFVDKDNSSSDGTCNSNDLQTFNNGVGIEISGTTGNANGWISGKNITLKAISNRFTIDCAKNKCEWSSKSGAKSTGKEIKINNTGILVTQYTFRYILNTQDNKSNYFTDTIDIKLDNQAPIIKNSTGAMNKFQKEKAKTVRIEATDGSNGSGIGKGYYLGLNNAGGCNSISDSSYKEANSSGGYREVVTQNGTYLICVKDNVGNTSSIVIDINTIITE